MDGKKYSWVIRTLKLYCLLNTKWRSMSWAKTSEKCLQNFGKKQIKRGY
jgi:hypothetical protein